MAEQYYTTGYYPPTLPDGDDYICGCVNGVRGCVNGYHPVPCDCLGSSEWLKLYGM